MKKIVISLLCLLGSVMAVELGKVPPVVVLSGDDGAKVDGKRWSSSMIKGKIYTLFYVDPDKKDLNDALANALNKSNFNRSKVSSIAIVNLAATWMPNALIESTLKKKQKQFPHTIYVKDKKKVLVKKWNLADDNSDILIFDKKGKLIYKKFGKVSDTEIKKVIKLIEKNL
ncbi:MAG: YtfJ family protein [Sulfurovum sp.]|nr:YtfJ family protein [Sulfurovum sp.]